VVKKHKNVTIMKLFNMALENKKLHHNVYVVELSKEVLKIKKFMDANPKYIKGKPCVYVGMTGLEPNARFNKHKLGIKSNTYVQKYGIKLLPNLYEKFNPMTFNDAESKEKEIAEDLRNNGYCVWYG